MKILNDLRHLIFRRVPAMERRIKQLEWRLRKLEREQMHCDACRWDQLAAEIAERVPDQHWQVRAICPLHADQQRDGGTAG